MLAQLLQRKRSAAVIGHCCGLCGSSRHGQPYLTNFTNPPAISISISHAGEWTAVAVNTSTIGIDIERCETDIDGLAEFTLDPADVGSLADPLSAAQSLTILQRWVMKEAVVKAGSVGLSVELADVALHRLAAHRWLASSPQLQSRYVVEQLDLVAPLIGAVATLHVTDQDGGVRSLSHSFNNGTAESPQRSAVRATKSEVLTILCR